MDIQVSNLNPSLIEADIQRIFTPFGEISSIEIYRDKLNNRPQGKALIKMPVKNEAQKAIASLQGTIVGGRLISVVEVPNMGETDFSTSMWRR